MVCFSNANGLAGYRCYVAGDTPGGSVGDIAKIIGEMWRGLSDADKKPYEVGFKLGQELD